MRVIGRDWRGGGQHWEVGGCVPNNYITTSDYGGQVLPHLLEFAQDQHGSRFLQGKLDEASPEESDLVEKHRFFHLS